MITLTRLNENTVIVNAAHIVTVESTPDTIITLFSGEKMIVREPPEEVVERAVRYLRRIGVGPAHPLPPPQDHEPTECSRVATA